MRFGVFGWPVAHSRSPAMFRALGVDYQLLPCPPELFLETARALGASGFGGANVTMPHKEAALALADSASARARAIGAANTLTYAQDGTISAENTDAPGVLAALEQDVAGKTALVLGAGGSARAIVWALQDAGAREVRIWNRTPERAEQIARDLDVTVTRTASPADVLVNCTAAGLEDPATTFAELPLDARDLGDYPTVVDMVYRAGGTAFLKAAKERGARTVDGLEVLVRQGAISYAIWTGLTPDLDAMRRGAAGTA